MLNITLNRILRWLILVPAICAILLELTLHIGSYINQHFLMHEQQTDWLTPNLRVVAMGDSNTYGLYLDKKDAYPKQLEAIWNTAHKNNPIEVINLGYPGSNSSRLVASIEEINQQFQPDIILVMIGTNDGWTAPIAAAESTLTNDHKLHPLQWLKSHSKLYRLFCLMTREPFQEQALETITTSDPTQAETAKGKPATINYKNMKLDFSLNFREKNTHFDVEADMQKNMEKLIQYGEKNNIKVFLLTYPANKGYYKQANKVAIKTASDNHYPYFINTIGTFKDLQTQKGENNAYFFLDLHATALGNKILATQAVKQLEAQLGVPPEAQFP